MCPFWVPFAWAPTAAGPGPIVTPLSSRSPSFAPLLSACRKFHSTETALFKLTNDIMETIDCNFSSHPILYLSSQVMYRREHSALLRLCKTTMATSKSFSSVASNIWNAFPNHLSSNPTLPAFRRALKHHLFLLAYPDSSAKSGKVKPAQCITLRDTAPTIAVAQPGNTIPPI